MSDKTRNSIAYLCWMLAAFAFLMFMGPAVKGADKIVPTEVLLPVDADTIRGDYRVVLPGVDSVAYIYKDSVFCTACDTVIDSHFVRISGDTLHIWDYYVVYPGNKPVSITWESDEIKPTVREGDGIAQVYFQFIDTSGGSGIQNVFARILDSSGTRIYGEYTLALGYLPVWLDSSKLYTIIGFGPSGLSWSSRSGYFADTGGTAGSPIQVSGYDAGTPSAAADPNYVTLYMDVGSADVDSITGAMIPRKKGKYVLSLIGEPTLNDGSWSLVPKEIAKRPDATGRVQWFIPANSILTPPGSYYELWSEIRDGYSNQRQLIRRFAIDTIPDPILILNTTEVLSR